jgi:formamidopyrimidine-DNA glycosylase
MSIEYPEASILAKQMRKVLIGKEVTHCALANCASMQKIGCVNKNPADFNALGGCRIEAVGCRGNTIKVHLTNGLNLILAPEYGGKILYHTQETAAPAKFNLKLTFKEQTALTVTLTGVGIIQVFKDAELEQSYIYRRDFSPAAMSLDDAEFTFNHFSDALSEKGNLKAALVGKDAVVVGLSNSAFQDILFRAHISPKQKASDLSMAAKRALYDAIKSFVQERLQAGGKNQFTDLHGNQGTYVAAMGPNMKGKPCPTCGTPVTKLSLGGGQVFCCPKCQI